MTSIVPQTALPGRSLSSHDRLARGLGYFSLALGVAELIAPGLICRAIGLKSGEAVVRGYGVREVGTGLAILASHDAAPWVWGRVAGDVADLATGGVMAENSASPRTLAAFGLLAGAAALDVFCGVGLRSEKGRRQTANTDYSDRSGFPRGLQAARGVARQADARPRREHAAASSGLSPSAAEPAASP